LCHSKNAWGKRSIFVPPSLRSKQKAQEIEPIKKKSSHEQQKKTFTTLFVREIKWDTNLNNLRDIFVSFPIQKFCTHNEKKTIVR